MTTESSIAFTTDAITSDPNNNIAMIHKVPHNSLVHHYVVGQVMYLLLSGSCAYECSTMICRMASSNNTHEGSSGENECVQNKAHYLNMCKTPYPNGGCVLNQKITCVVAMV